LSSFAFNLDFHAVLWSQCNLGMLQRHMTGHISLLVKRKLVFFLTAPNPTRPL
jgi:hypothetical protein